jgi:hypothetical protein
MSGDDHFFDVYDVRFYRNHAEGDHYTQTRMVGEAIARVFQPKTVIDVGCGVGAMLEGVSSYMGGRVRCVGIEAPIAIERMKEGGSMHIPVEWYYAMDLRLLDRYIPAFAKILPEARFDLAISCEVGEHLPPENSETLVRALAALSDTVVFSAAYPGQGGDQHIAERPFSWWISAFGRSGYYLDERTTREVIEFFRDQATRPWGYAKNMRIFRRKG